MNVVFAGTPAFSLASLTALIDHPGTDIVGIYTQPDRPSGRGKKLTASPVKQLALRHDLKVYQPNSLRSGSEIDTLAELKPDLMVVVAYGLILPPNVLTTPGLGCVNIHASLLPRWRGAAPIQRAIEAGDKETGISLMQMEAGLDTGPVLSTLNIPIGDQDTGESLHDTLSVAGGALLADCLDDLRHQKLLPVPQDHQLATYADKLKSAEATIDWNTSALKLERKIRAFYPWPVMHTSLDGQVIRILRAHCDPGGNDTVLANPATHQTGIGVVTDANRSGIRVMTGKGELRITRLQKSGGNPMDAQAFLNGVKVTPGTRFG